MAIRSKSLDDMIREVFVSLKTGEPKRPAFTLLVGSGFSFPIIPTPTQMLKGDIAWWLYLKDQKISDPFCSRAEGVAGGKATEDQLADFERQMWKPIHTRAAVSKDAAFGLTADGVPDLDTPNAVGLAYQAVMADGLLNNKMRRHYLRDAIQRSYPKVNGAHIFLAGILEAQETWDWGAPFCRTIFTTNFDPLLQRSLQLVNKLYYMTDRPDVLEPPDDDQSEAIHLIYTHGSVHRYDLLNTEDEIKKARERNAPTLIDYFRRHGVIVMGYSGWADTTMEALTSCPAFDSNLYWCDVHPAAEAELRLRTEVLKMLNTPEKHAYYVTIPGADEAMRLLHRELKLGDVPKFILAPVETMIIQLKSIDVPSEPTASTKPEATPLSTSLATLLEGTLKRLDVAKSAFDDPSIVRPSSSQGQEEVAEALIAQLRSDAFVAYTEGKRDHAVALWSALIATSGVPAKDRTVALCNRGLVLHERGETKKAIADYTTVIGMLDAPPDQKARALNNRGCSLVMSGKNRKAITDFTTVINMADTSASLKAMTLNNRGFEWVKKGNSKKAIADFTAVINLPGAPADQKAIALNNRGVTSTASETAERIADFTAVIDMPDVTASQRAKALNNRGFAWREIGETVKEIADYTAVIDLTDAPNDQKAKAFLNRGWTYFNNLDDVESMIGDSQNALSIEKYNPAARSNLALGLLLFGEADEALAKYEALLSLNPDVTVVRAAVENMETALRKRPEVPEAAKILEYLRRRLLAKEKDPADGTSSSSAGTSS